MDLPVKEVKVKPGSGGETEDREGKEEGGGKAGLVFVGTATTVL